MVFNKPYDLLSTSDRSHIATIKSYEEHFKEFTESYKNQNFPEGYDPVKHGKGFHQIKTKEIKGYRRSISEYSNAVRNIIYDYSDPDISNGKFKPPALGINSQPRMPYRLGKNVTGCLILPRQKGFVSDSLNQLHNNMLMSKVFLAVVIGRPEQNEGIFDIPIKKSFVNQFNNNVVIDRSVLDHNYGKSEFVPDSNDLENYQKMLDQVESLKTGKVNDMKKFKSKYFGQRALTYYKMLAYSYETNTAVLQLQPFTYTENQLEVHMADGLGCPILGDHKHCSDGKARGGMSKKYHKWWYEHSYSQPLPVNVYQAMRWAHPSTVHHLPLHLHCLRVYIPGMAGDRSIFDNQKQVRDQFLNPEHENYRENYVLNDGSDLICEAPVPDFWHETLRMLKLPWTENILKRVQPPKPPRLMEQLYERNEKMGENKETPENLKLDFKVLHLPKYYEGKINLQTKFINPVKLAKGHKSKYFDQMQKERRQALGSRNSGHPQRNLKLKAQERQAIFEKMIEDQDKKDALDSQKSLRMDRELTGNQSYSRQITDNLSESANYRNYKIEQRDSRYAKIRGQHQTATGGNLGSKEGRRAVSEFGIFGESSSEDSPKISDSGAEETPRISGREKTRKFTHFD